VLIDGAIDRRAASSPTVADGLVMATGAVLSEEIEAVVAATKDAVDLVMLPMAGLPVAGEVLADAPPVEDAPVDGEEKHLTLPRQLVLAAEPSEIAALLRENPQADTFRIDGALSERFLEGLLAARTERAQRTLRIVVSDPTKVFLSHRGPSWYRRQGVAIEVLRTIDLKAITVNPVAPQSHRFDSQELRGLIEAAVPDVPVRSYLALAK
jgi:hypothetical protein